MARASSGQNRPLTDPGQGFNREQLLMRYARGRVTHFLNRQFLTMMGSSILILMNGLPFGIAAMLIALLGEAVDCLYLRTVPAQVRRRVPTARIMWISTLTAAFQAATIAACVALALTGPNSQASPLFAMSFLAGAAVNAGLVLPFHKPAAIARLSLYGATTLVFLAADADKHGLSDVIFLMNATGTAILSYMVYAFLTYVANGFQRNRRNVEAITSQSRALEVANKALQQRQKEAARLSLVAKNANDAVILCDAEGRIFWVNDAFTRITGYSLEEASGRRPGDLLNCPETDPATIARLNGAIRLGQAFRGELQNVTKDGRRIWIETNQVPVLGQDGRIEMTVAIERDVTRTKATEKALAEAKVRAEDGARAKADFLATMSHEIRTPMNGVIGMADLLCDTQLDADQRLYSETIRSSGQALLTIINDILDLSKLDADKMPITPVDFDLRDCVRDAVLLLQAQAREKGLSLSLDIAESTPLRIHADDGRLRQILINLVGNALKFTETGGVTVRVAPQELSGQQAVFIEVEDTGIGIAEDKLGHVFQRFSQAESSTTRRFGGTGLGLTISRLLVEAMGGEIGVSSTLGKGSVFFLTLPYEPPQQDAAPDTHVTNLDNCAETLRGKRVLVAEDNRVNRLLISRYLKDMPLELHFAHDGQQAVDMAQSKSPDMVFMDMSMPLMSGIEATGAIRKMPTAQPAIVALTANAFESDREACLAAGMDGFLTKPVRRNDLLAAMIRHCGAPPAPPVL